jgi:transposase-like protein
MSKAAVFQDPMFHDEDKAREALEAVRWPDDPVCPHCGNSDQEKLAKVEGKKHSHRAGLYYCNECKGQFTVTVGSVFERSKVPLTKWVDGCAHDELKQERRFCARNPSKPWRHL